MKLEKKEYTTRAEKRMDFGIGVVVFFGLNVLITLVQYLLLGVLLYAFKSSEASEVMGYGISCLAFPLQILVNIGVVVYFALTRTWIAIGMLGAFGFLMGLMVILGIILSVVCLATGGF